MYLVRHPEEKEEIQVDMETILFSVACAVLHGVVEIFMLNVESLSAKTSVLHYLIVCFNGRFGWVPYTNKFKEATDEE